MINQVPPEIFATRLRAVMSSKRVKGIDLADKLDVSPQTITGWRNGQYLPEQSKWGDVCKALDLDEDDLFRPARINQATEEPPARYPTKRPMRMPHSHGYGLPDDLTPPSHPASKLTRAQLEADISYYLDRAERAGALAVAALAVRKYLNPADFDYFDDEPPDNNPQ